MLTFPKGKNVVVTGASKGIGKGIARVFAGKGAQVAVVARNLRMAEECEQEIRNSGGYAEAFHGDVSERASMDKMAREVADSFGGIDVLCSNAGIFPSANLETMTEKDWDIVMNTNARGTLFAIQACLPYLNNAR